jgi:hypothetical protein
VQRQKDELAATVDRISRDIAKVEAVPEPERPFESREVREPAGVVEALRPPAMPWERNGPAR